MQRRIYKSSAVEQHPVGVIASKMQAFFLFYVKQNFRQIYDVLHEAREKISQKMCKDPSVSRRVFALNKQLFEMQRILLSLSLQPRDKFNRLLNHLFAVFAIWPAVVDFVIVALPLNHSEALRILQFRKLAAALDVTD